MRQETLGLARDIAAGKTDVGFLENSITVRQTVDFPTIRSVFKGDAAMVAYSVVKVLVKRFLDSFGFSTKHSEIQVETFTADILDNFKYESLQDIILFLKMARQGKLGATGRGVDSNLIVGEWMPKYLEIKAEEREMSYSKTKKALLSDLDMAKIYSSETAQRRRELEEREFRNYVEEMTKGITREQLEILIDKCSKVEEVQRYMWILKLKRREIK